MINHILHRELFNTSIALINQTKLELEQSRGNQMSTPTFCNRQEDDRSTGVVNFVKVIPGTRLFAMNSNPIVKQEQQPVPTISTENRTNGKCDGNK